MPRSAAASILFMVAWPMSYSSSPRCASFSGSLATSAIVAAEPAMCLPPRSQTLASSISCPRSVTTTKFHGCPFPADGARRPASQMRSRSSRAIGWPVYWRTLRRARMASHVSMPQSYRTAAGRRSPASDIGRCLARMAQATFRNETGSGREPAGPAAAPGPIPATPGVQMTVVVNSRDDFTLENYQRVTMGGESVAIGPEARRTMAEGRAGFLRLLESDRTQFIYGVTSSYGPRAKLTIPPGQQRAHARAFGFRGNWGRGFGGGYLDERVVRGILFARLANFVAGNSKARPIVAERLAALLDGPLPRVPLDGEFGAPLDSYDDVLDDLWGDEDEASALAALRRHLEGASPHGRRPAAVPASYRVLGRVLGQAHRAVRGVEEAARVSLRSVTDNPVYVPPGEGHPLGRAFSAGGFHNAKAYPALNALAAAWADLTLLIQRHVTALGSTTASAPPARASR